MRCAATTASGEQCKNEALDGSEYCGIHNKDESSVCGHVNRHAFDIDGNPEELYCEKEKGHSGPHGALHLEARYKKGTDQYEKGWPKEVWTEWRDMAATPVDDIPMGELPNKNAQNAESILRQIVDDPEAKELLRKALE
jgi:hypothetical protein